MPLETQPYTTHSKTDTVVYLAKVFKIFLRQNDKALYGVCRTLKVNKTFKPKVQVYYHIPLGC